MTISDLLVRLIIELEQEKHANNMIRESNRLAEFARVGNVKEMDLCYKSIRELVKKHKQLIAELRNNQGNSNGND